MTSDTSVTSEISEELNSSKLSFKSDTVSFLLIDSIYRP